MHLNDWLTVLAILLGPIVAVGITLWIEGERRKRESRVIVLRQLMATRHLAGDPMYSTAVNLIPIEFNDEPGVMAAYKAYQDAVAQVPGDDPEAIERCARRTVVKQTKMIFAIMQALKLRASEADIPSEAYAAKGMIARDNLFLRSLEGTVRIADALERQANALESAAKSQ
jgi:hypothetical protein